MEKGDPSPSFLVTDLCVFPPRKPLKFHIFSTDETRKAPSGRTPPLFPLPRNDSPDGVAMIKMDSTKNHRRMNMKKGLLFVVAALLAVSLPLSASAGTEVYRVVDQDLNNLVEAQMHSFMCFPYDSAIPNLAYVFADKLGPYDEVCLRYVNATYSETVRVKTNKDGTKDLGWNLVGHGTVQIWKKGYGGPGLSTSALEGGMKVYTTSSVPLEGLLYEGPVQVEQVVQDDGNDAGCAGYQIDYNGNMISYVPAEGTPLELWNCGGYPDFVMYHWKLTGNRIAFNKLTIKNGIFTWRNEIEGFEVSLPMQ